MVLEICGLNWIKYNFLHDFFVCETSNHIINKSRSLIMRGNPEIPLKIYLLHVVVFENDLNIDIITVRDENFGEDLTFF